MFKHLHFGKRRGVAALAAALKTNTRVTELDLSDNEAITDAGGRALLDMLRANTAVRAIGLDRFNKGMSAAVRKEVGRLAEQKRRVRAGTATARPRANGPAAAGSTAEAVAEAETARPRAGLTAAERANAFRNALTSTTARPRAAGPAMAPAR